MKQEDKLLLIQDLSARLPYAVTIEHTSGFRGTLHDITVYHIYDDNDKIYDAICYTDFFGDKDYIYIEYFKPCLFPRSSMTETQRKEYESWCIKESYEYTDLYGTVSTKDYYYDTVESIDYLYKNHFDFRGLIPKGLAIDATGLNIY